MVAAIKQAPAGLNVAAVEGDPLSLLIEVGLTDGIGETVPWSAVTDPVVVVMRNGNRPAPTTAAPAVSSPAANQWLITWSAAQTAALGGFISPLAWALSATINGVGPQALVAGELSLSPSTEPGPSTPATADLVVQVGTATAALAVTIAALLVDEIDGGSPDSVYLSSQGLNGGTP